MTRAALYSAIVLAVAVISAPALAQSLAGHMDLAGLDAARGDFFMNADKNADFALSSGELSDALGFMATQAFDGKDLDGDGLISYSEYLDYGAQIFNLMDLNGDGVLSPDEF